MGAVKKQCWKSSEDWNEWDAIYVYDEGCTRVIELNRVSLESVLSKGMLGAFNRIDMSITPDPQHTESVKKFIAKCRLKHPDFPYWVKEEESGKESD